MDRNGLGICHYRDDISSLSARRAWIEITERPAESRSNMSLSARRAWIEILPPLKLIACHNVALRKESVDRNMLFLSFRAAVGSSLSARRAWIEMRGCWLPDHSWWVALRKESVDRNSTRLASFRAYISRSPQGERG